MTTNGIKVATVLCNCGGTLKNIDWEEIQGFMEEKGEPGDICAYHENLCSKTGKAWLHELMRKEGADMSVFGGCTPKTAGFLFEDLLKDIGFTPFQIVGANLREHVGWIHTDTTQATNKAKALLLAAYNKAKMEKPYVPRHKIVMSNNVVVIGAGPAGMQAAQDLATGGYHVYLIDRNPYIGGNPVKLGLFFPSDDCAACLSAEGVKGVHQSNVRRCLYRSAFDLHPNIHLLPRTEVERVDGMLGNYKVALKTKPTYVDMKRCVNCGLCAQVCPVEKPDEMNLGLITRKAIHMPSVTTATTKYVLNREECLESCTKCALVCPVDAIDLDQQESTRTLTAGGFIVATGFQEYDPRLVSEYNYGQEGYDNVITQLELARFLDITGPTSGSLKKKDGTDIKDLVMINCVGSRSEKYNSWCSNICCMVGLKHAIKIKESRPEIDVTICYIDIRVVGPGYEEYYKKARELGVKFIRGRPSNVESDGMHFYVNVEDIGCGEHRSLKADTVVLSMAMVPSSGVKELAEKLKVDIDETGYFEALYSKLRSTETKQPGVFVGGTAISPADIPTAVTRASHAAKKLESLLMKAVVEKRFPIADINQETCINCELCVSACPFGAIETITVSNPDVMVQVNPISCMGCGHCVSTCPVSAIDIGYYREEQIMSEMEGLLYDSITNPEPIIIAFTCWECAYGATDYIGQLGLTRSDMHYPHNVRILPVQCTGSISARMIQKTFELGADGVLIVGCFEDRCHYDTGSKASTALITLLKQMLAQQGLDPRRLEKEFLFCSAGDIFVNISRQMTDTITKLGKLQRK